jgi:transglutaminase/protease-like cytokinesis protein 3
MLVTVIPVGTGENVYAATVSTFSSTKKAIVYGKSAKIKLPSGYKNCKFTSSNKKVATVSSKGVVKAVRLGVAQITAKSGGKKKTYTITVTPAKSGEVWLNQEAILKNQKITLKLASDKYDTSQVKLNFYCAYSAINSKGVCSGVNQTGWGSVAYSYGSFSKSTKLAVYDPESIFDELLNAINYTKTSGYETYYQIYAGESYKESVLSMLDGKSKVTPKQLKKKGISILLDGKEMSDTQSYTAGTHTLSIVSGSTKYEKKFSVSYTVKNALLKRDATGFSEKSKAVFDAAFTALNQIITDGMTDEQKVTAIHDYLIYNADYYSGDAYDVSTDNWKFGATGVLQYGQGVCQSYAIAFYMMTTAAGLQCQYITSATHAWNRVLVDGVWYYVDCTFDDPVGSAGAENHNYFLSETNWSDSDHVITEVTEELADKSIYLWDHYYLTGEYYGL